mgnify:CR=1 FL=1
MFRRTLTDTDANTRQRAGATNRNPTQRRRRLFRERLYFLIAVTTRNPNLIPKIGVFLYGDRIVRNSKILAEPLQININSVDRNFRDRGFKKEGKFPIDVARAYGLPDPRGWRVFRDIKAGGEDAEMTTDRRDASRTADRAEETNMEPLLDNDQIDEEDRNPLNEDGGIDNDLYFDTNDYEFCDLDEVYGDDNFF